MQEMKSAVQELRGNAFAVTSIGVAVNTENGYKAYDPVTKQIRVSNTVMPLKASFYAMQTPIVKEGDFVEVNGNYLQVILAGENSLGVLDLQTGEQKTIIKETSPDGIKFATVVRSSLPANVINKLVAGTLSTEQMLLVSGDKSLQDILALKLVAENDELDTEALAMFLQSR